LWQIYLPLRSPKVALYEMEGHSEKIMCCDWSVGTKVASGSSDNTLKIYNVAAKLQTS
jgi:ribosome biogenesis protein YTM1